MHLTIQCTTPVSLSQFQCGLKLCSDNLVHLLLHTAIEMPLFVVRDFGAESRRHYLHCLSRTKWPGLFTLKIKELMAHGKERGKKRSRCIDQESPERGDNDHGEEDDTSYKKMTVMMRSCRASPCGPMRQVPSV